MAAGGNPQKKSWTVSTPAAVAEFFDVPTDTVDAWSRLGMPRRAKAFDLSEIARWLRHTDAFHVQRQTDIASFCGVSIDTVKSWAKQRMPGQPGMYDLGEIVRWLRASGPWRQHQRPEFDDPLLVADGESPGLERYRLAKAAIAELDLEERKESLLSRDKARAALIRWGSIIRRLGERLGKRFGPDASNAVNDALSECQHIVDHEFGGCDTSDDDSPE